MEHSNWQLRLCSHKQRCKYAFDNMLFSDVEFSVVDCDGDKVTVPANRYPLAMCSPVFEAMFYGNLAETKFPVHIEDGTEEGLKEIIRYAYYQEAKLTKSNVMDVFYLAKKYMMPSLEEKCKEYIKSNFGADYVMTILPEVLNIGDENLQNHLWRFVDKNIKKIASSNSFMYISRELLIEILKRDTLKVDEIYIYKALDKWVTKRIEENMELCNGETKRAILGQDIIRLIRFPLMSEKEFVEVVLASEILNSMEVSEMMSVYNGIVPSVEIFSQKKRSTSALVISDVRFNKDSMMERPDDNDDDDDETSTYVEKPDSLNFTVNKQVNLVGVRLFGNKDATYNVKLNISRNNPFVGLCHKRQLSYRTEEQMIDGLYYGFTVNLNKPVRLKPDIVYNIQAHIKGPLPWYGQNGNSVVSAGEQIQITYTKDGSIIPNGTSDEEGQFPSLVLENI